jgi:hypothetical protein
VHKSPEEASDYVSCGEVLSVQEPAPSPSAAPVAPMATPSAGVTAPNTGSGSRAGEDHTGAVVVLLVLVGLMTLGAGSAMRVQAR